MKCTRIKKKKLLFYYIGLTFLFEAFIYLILIRLINFQPDIMPNIPFLDYYHKIKLHKDIKAVVIGFDAHFSYLKLLRACTYLKDPSCRFIATNTDERYALKSNLIIPSAGAIVAALEAVSRRRAVVMGKPSKYSAEYVLKKTKVKPERALMIGDR